VKEGVITRGAKCRIFRNDVLIADATIVSLKRFKDDVREVAAGYECGIGVSSNISDVEVGDVIATYRVDEKARTLDSP
jgi:translation initiation factor IF-2